jgi:hypothetical protein
MVQQITFVQGQCRFVGLDRRLRWERPGTFKQLEKLVDVAGDQGRIETYDPFAVTRVGRQRITPQIWHLLPQRPAKSKAPLTERPSGVSRLVLEQRIDNRFTLNAGDWVDTEEQEQLRVADAKEPVARPDFTGPEAPDADRGRT